MAECDGGMHDCVMDYEEKREKRSGREEREERGTGREKPPPAEGSLSDEGECDLWRLVGLSEHGGTGLGEHLSLGEFRRFSSDVDIDDAVDVAVDVDVDVDLDVDIGVDVGVDVDVDVDADVDVDVSEASASASKYHS